MSTKQICLIGKRFGRLTVLEIDMAKTKQSNSWWLCLCDCGSIKSISRIYLAKKIKNKGCGCKPNLKQAA